MSGMIEHFKTRKSVLNCIVNSQLDECQNAFYANE